MVMTISAPPTASGAESAASAPASTAAATAERLRSEAASQWPAFSRFRAIGRPMFPRPTKPIAAMVRSRAVRSGGRPAGTDYSGAKAARRGRPTVGSASATTPGGSLVVWLRDVVGTLDHQHRPWKSARVERRAAAGVGEAPILPQPLLDDIGRGLPAPHAVGAGGVGPVGARQQPPAGAGGGPRGARHPALAAPP